MVISSPKYWNIYITSVKALVPVNYVTGVSYDLKNQSQNCLTVLLKEPLLSLNKKCKWKCKKARRYSTLLVAH